MAAERKNRYTPRTFPYREFGGPFIDPLEVEKIKAQGDVAIRLRDFLSEHGMEITEGHEVFVETLFLRTDPQINFTDTPEGAFFSARNVEHVVSGLSMCNSMELAPHLQGGGENMTAILNWLTDIASKKHFR